MKYTIGERKKGHDSATLYADGEAVGFVGDGSIGLERCPECGKENYAMAVLSGVCCWCGFEIDANEVFKKEEA